MKVIIALLIFFTTQNAQAGIVLAAGGAFSGGHDSEEKAINEKELLVLDSSLGILLDAEIPFLGGFFSVNSSLFLSEQDGIGQYVTTNNTLISDLKTKGSTVVGMVGGRLRLLNFKKFKLFIGGGGLAGSLNLEFDKKDFLSKGGIEANFREQERASSWGAYAEVGTEYIVNKKSAVRAGVRLMDVNTQSFKTMGSNRIDMDYALFTLSYMHYFDWKFRRK